MNSKLEKYGIVWNTLGKEKRLLILTNCYNSSRDDLCNLEWDKLSFNEKDTIRYYL
jgi:hypothetical protein